MNQLRSRKFVASLSLLATTGLFVASPGVAQTSSASDQASDQPIKLDKFEVTGSYIPVAAGSPAIPVTTISSADIQNTGVSTNVLEILKKAMPQFSGNTNLGGDNGNISSNSTNGGSQVALRNRATLVLINGRRVAVSPVAGTGGYLFVDVNLIPPSAIEKIEVLTDGASATYGSDAVSGVVNIILKSDYQGGEVGGSYGFHQGPSNEGHYAERQGYAVMGAANGKTGVTVSTEWFKSDPIFQKQRPFSSTIYGTASFPGVIDDNVQYYYYLNPSLNAPPTGHQSIADLVGAGVYTGPYEDEIVEFFNLAEKPTLIIGNERLSASVMVDHRLTDNVKLFGDFLYSNTKTFSQLNAQPVYGTVAADNLNNPTDQEVFAYNRFVAYPRQYFTDTTAIRGIAGAKGEINEDWSWETAGMINRSTQAFRNPNLIDATAYNAAVEDGSYNPFARVQADGVVEGFLGTSYGDYVSGLNSWDARVSGKVYDLPAGAINAAVGFEYRREYLTYDTDRNNQEGLWLRGTPNRPFSAARASQAVFGEVRVPIFSAAQGVRGFHTLEASVAVRHETYDDTEDPTVPKFSLRYLPIDDQFAIRASYSESFTAPTLYELNGPVSEGFTSSIKLTKYSDGTKTGNRQYQSASGSNPDLIPSKSRNWTTGIVYSPKALKGFSIEADWFSIDERDLVSSIGTSRILQDVETNGASSIYANHVAIGNFINRGGTAITAPGLITSTPSSNVYVVDTLINVSGLEQDGFDVKVRYDKKTQAFGRFGLLFAYTYINTFKYKSLPDADTYDYSGAYTESFGTLPRWRTYTSLDWQYRAYNVTLANTFIPTVKDPDYDENYEVASFASWDLRASVDFSNFGFKGLSGAMLTVGVNNVFNKYPPYTPSESNQNADIGTYGAIGRLIYISASYKF